MILVLVVSLALLSSMVLTSRIKTYAERRKILDIPNHRSLHETAVPRGGGLGFVVTILLGLPVLWLMFPAEEQLWLSLAGSVVIALTGWIDDRVSLSSGLRFLIHGLTAAWVVWILGGLASIRIGTWDVELGVLGAVFAWLLIVWLINLYNFMDGIDGLAAGQAVLVGSVGALLASASGSVGVAWFAAVVAASCAGFLRWNLPPARIFMGDAGSGFLGFVFAVLALYSEGSGGPGLLVWLLLLGVFVVDTTATLLRRWLSGEPWFEAHRSHAYQRAVRLGYSHRFVMIAVLSMTLALAVVAWLVSRVPAVALPVSLLNFGILLVLWRYVVSQPEGSESGGGLD